MCVCTQPPFFAFLLTLNLSLASLTHRLPCGFFIALLVFPHRPPLNADLPRQVSLMCSGGRGWVGGRPLLYPFYFFTLKTKKRSTSKSSYIIRINDVSILSTYLLLCLHFQKCFPIPRCTLVIYLAYKPVFLLFFMNSFIYPFHVQSSILSPPLKC